MRKLFYICLVAMACFAAACDNYVDIKPTGKKTVDSAQTYYELINLPNRSYYPGSFALLSDNTWYVESKIIGSENISYDGINMTFNESADREQLSDNNLYANAYEYILRSNIVLSNIDHSLGTDSIKRLAKAEAKIMRAWDHFVVVNTFAKAYNPETAAKDGGVPIMDVYDLEVLPRKSTVAEVYNFILKDIDEALPYLQETPLNVYHPSKAFGYALSALVRLFHRDWAEAKDAAQKSLALKSDLIDYIALEKLGGPNKYKGYAKGDNPEVLNYAYQGSPTENPSYTYGLISPELIKLYGDNDLRYSLFFKDSGLSIYTFDAGSGAALWDPSITYSKFMYMSVGLRTAEVYLILAEADARLGNLGEASSTLNTLRTKRIKGSEAALARPSGQSEMLQAVILERRKELLFGFHRFWDMKRLAVDGNMPTVTRTFPLVNTDVEQKTYTLRPNSPLYVIPFPISAREKNSNLTSNTND